MRAEQLRRSLAHPKVIALAGRLNIDLTNELQRNALVALAAAQLQKLAASDMGSSAASTVLNSPAVQATNYQVLAALRSYREIAAL